MNLKRLLLLLLSMIFALMLAIPSSSAVYATELSSNQVAALERLFILDDLTFNHGVNLDGATVLTVKGQSFEFEIKSALTVSELAKELEAHQYTGLGAIDPVIANLTIEEVMTASTNVAGISEIAGLFSGAISPSRGETVSLNENDVSDTPPAPLQTWVGIPIVAGDTDGVYMRAKTNKQIYAVGEVIYTTVYVSGLDEAKENEKEVLVHVEGHAIAPVALNAQTINGTASGIVGSVASKAEAVKLDIIVEYGDGQSLEGSIPLTFNSASVSDPTLQSNPQTPPVNIELVDSGKKGSGLPKTSDVSPSTYAMGGMTFVVMVICLVAVIQLARRKKVSCSTVSSMMYDRGYTYGGRMDIYSEKEDSNEEQIN